MLRYATCGDMLHRVEFASQATNRGQPASQPNQSHVFYVTLCVTLTRVTSARPAPRQPTAADNDDDDEDDGDGKGGEANGTATEFLRRKHASSTAECDRT